MRNRMSELEDTNIKDDIDKYYYAYFEIDSDGDFYFEDYIFLDIQYSSNPFLNVLIYIRN